MTSSRSRLVAALAIVAAAFFVTACGSDDQPDPVSTDTSAATPDAPGPDPSETEIDEPNAVDPTCETIISDSIVADFASIGWSVQTDPFYIGELEIAEGLTCVWADFNAPAGDHLQLFGWAPIEAAEAKRAQDSLLSQGWRREESGDGVYITEPQETTIQVDDDGYGMTYLFTDGAVKLADTKQGLLLVEWPKG